MHNFGYACINENHYGPHYRTTRLKNLNPNTQRKLIDHNLLTLKESLYYNIENDISLFRISTDLIPFATKNLTSIDWEEEFKSSFNDLKKTIDDHHLKISMHPSHFCILNSPHKNVLSKARLDLEYHTRVLQLLSDRQSFIILHVGGVYGDKQLAKKRFITNFQSLDSSIRKRILIENDEKSYNIEDVLELAHATGAPAAFDFLHHKINSPSTQDVKYWLLEAKKTWQNSTRKQKVHYSQQDLNKRIGSHSPTIFTSELYEDFQNLCSFPLDVMLEVKDKNRSANKCITLHHPKKSRLEKEWARYKYSVLEKSPTHYQQLRNFLKRKHPDPYSFYYLIEEALLLQENKKRSLNALEHVWGYLKKISTATQKDAFFRSLTQYQNEQLSLASLKKKLLRLVYKYKIEYLLDSYFFYDDFGSRD